MKNKEKYGGTFRPDGFVSLNMIVDNMIKKESIRRLNRITVQKNKTTEL